MNFIDLRSDTVTLPTPEMREAMAEADVGDDVYGEDPTVNRLQATAAKMLGKEAGLLVPSGTMGNLAAILAHCGRGDEVILGDKSHTFLHEAGGISALGGVHSCQIPNQSDGTLRLEDIEAAVRSDDVHYPITRLISLENTQNRCGGSVLSYEYTRKVGDFAHTHGLRLHLDGARLFNAAVAQNTSAALLAAPADSVTICLSKGLCAPVGSVLCGTEEFIRKAHRLRKMLGAGMRQAGIIAAGGLVALDTMVNRLIEDHTRAKRLAAGISQIPGLSLTHGEPQSNMVFIGLDDSISFSADELTSRLEQHGIKIGVVAPRELRLVTHYWIDDAAIDQTVRTISQIL